MSDNRKICIGTQTIIINNVPDDVSDEQLREQLYVIAKEEIRIKNKIMKEIEGRCS